MTKQIPLTQGKFALVDDDMYDYLMQWKWNAHWTGKCFYARRDVWNAGKRSRIYMHRLVLQAQKGTKVDHRNNIETLNNTRENLRICTSSQNMCNVGLKANNRSGYKGVYWEKYTQKYRAAIAFNNIKFKLGRFVDPIEAARAYDAKARELHGDFARTNF